MKRFKLIVILFLLFTNLYAQLNNGTVRILFQYANDMTFDSTLSQIIISIPSKDNLHGNAIGFVNPDSVVLSEHYFIGSEPNPIALTDNQHYLYVGMDGSKT